jgi:hypothetical protein
MNISHRIDETSSSPSWSTVPQSVEPFKYTRFADPDSGNRLSEARNLMHTQAPLTHVVTYQEQRTAAGSVASEVAHSMRQAALIPPGAPKHEWEKGSYRSRCDYRIVGCSGGDKCTAYDRLPPYASPNNTTPFTGSDSMAVAHNRVTRETPVFDGMDPNSESAPPCRVVTPGSDVSLNQSLYFSSCATN